MSGRERAAALDFPAAIYDRRPRRRGARSITMPRSPTDTMAPASVRKKLRNSRSRHLHQGIVETFGLAQFHRTFVADGPDRSAQQPQYDFVRQILPNVAAHCDTGSLCRSPRAVWPRHSPWLRAPLRFVAPGVPIRSGGAPSVPPRPEPAPNEAGHRRNRLPNDPTYLAAGKRWVLCPESLRSLFTVAFTAGLREPAKRVTEGQWQALFLQLKDGAVACPGCKLENLWDTSSKSLNCWNCGKVISIPPRLVLTHPGGVKHVVVLAKNAKLLKRHINPAADQDGAQIVGEVVQNPANPQIWGIKNLTQTPWTGILADGTAKEYIPQKAVPLNPGIKLNLAGTSAEIVL